MSRRAANANKEKARRLEARENLRKAKTGLGNRLDEHELQEEDDIYDEVDEEQYAAIVEGRRAKGEFVVDDDGIGYKDNGEEILGVVDDPHEARKRALAEEVDGTGAGDSRTAKKLRQLGLSSGAPAGQKNTLNSFLRPGVVANKERPAAREAVPDAISVDDLMKSVSNSHPSAPQQGRRQGSSAAQQHQQQPARHVVRRAMPPPLPPRGAPPRYRDDVDSSEIDAGAYEQGYEQGHDAGSGEYVPPPSSSEAATQEAAAAEATTQQQQPVTQKLSLTKTTKTFKKAAAVEAFKPDLDDLELLGDVAMEPELLMGDSIGSSASLLPVDPALWLQHTGSDQAEPSSPPTEFLHMYWLDATELHGVVYLFGKVAIPEEGVLGGTKYVSCCVAVNGCERNLFVLGRATGETKSDGSAVRAGMGEVHAEVTRLLVPGLIPKSQGQGFKCKKVRRRYAFEQGDVPREETDYLKVVYSAKFGAPSPAQCGGGQSIERVFGATSSALELFLLKRRLLGPCWLTIRNPKTVASPMSWCKIEVGVESPKLVSRSEEVLAVPPVVALCLSLKTAVNPATHTHEVVAISCLLHTRVDVEADTPVDPRHFRRFTLVRPLGLSCGAAYTPNFPHDLGAELSKAGAQMSVLPNERALLNTFFQRLGMEDPDVLAAHNLFGFEFDVIIGRAVAHKLAGNAWSKLGRLRRSVAPRSISDRDFAAGRVLCDTYKAAKEFLRETTYSLSHLAHAQLGVDRREVDPVDVPKYFSCAADIVKLLYHTANDAALVMRLMLKLQVIPLTKTLTNLSGNLWSRTMRGARAERIEYLLLHEFYEAKFVLPEKKAMDGGGSAGGKKSSLSGGGRGGAARQNQQEEGGGEDEDGAGGGGRVGGQSRSKAKAAYAGGLVLEPKKGLYDTFILLLDFNSLYPSIIQEYNLCFTTIRWTDYMPAAAAAGEGAAGGKAIENEEPDEDADALAAVSGGADRSIPPLPEASCGAGILPRVIKNLVEKRKQVKALLKRETDLVKKQVYDIRQKALKLTANSMYGCLGFSFSRFYARPIAALVTAMGREALQRTVNLATNQMQLDVIYGDTDSVMINTGSTDLAHVKEVGVLVRKEVNKLYRCLELDIDGIFKSMLLLKKKKYAAVTINERVDGSVFLEKEMKGLDLVRRDWCPLSKEAGKTVVDEILSGKPREEIVESIHAFISELTRRVRAGEEELARFVVTKGLNKSPKDYPDCKGQAHLQVALRMLAANRPVNIGDHIPYVICREGADEGLMPAARAHHPDEVRRAAGTLTVDVEWYLENQVLPPISRLCEPIEGTSVAILSSFMGLDASKYSARRAADERDLEEEWGYQVKSRQEDAVRFAACEPLVCRCASCGVEAAFPGVVHPATRQSGLCCVSCGALYLGRSGPRDAFCYLSNRVTLLVRACLKKYYDAWLQCDDHTCGCRTRQQSVRGAACVLNCHGRLVQEYDEEALHLQLRLLETLFDAPRYRDKHGGDAAAVAAVDSLPADDEGVFRLLRQHMSNAVQGSAYNWVLPGMWAAVFGGVVGGGGAKRLTGGAGVVAAGNSTKKTAAAAVVKSER